MIRAGVIGAGSWAARCHIPTLVAEEDVQVVVLNRRNEELARKVADRFSIPNWTTDWREVLQYDLDALVVASPPAAHEEQVTAAIRAGIPVLCEKPFAMTSASAWRMVAEAEEAGQALLVAFGWNYMPILQAARYFLRDPGIGRVEFLSLLIVDKTRGLLSAGLPYRSASREFPPDPATYREPSVSGGGVAAVTLSHAFGLISYLTDLDVTHVCACLAGDTIDLHGALTLTFSGGGIGSVAGASAPDTDLPVGWHIHVVGDRGELLVDTARDEVTIATPGRMQTASLPPGAGTYDPSGPARRLVGVCRGEPVGDESPGRLGAISVAITEAAYRSAAEARPIEVARPGS